MILKSVRRSIVSLCCIYLFTWQVPAAWAFEFAAGPSGGVECRLYEGGWGSNMLTYRVGGFGRLNFQMFYLRLDILYGIRESHKYQTRYAIRAADGSDPSKLDPRKLETKITKAPNNFSIPLTAGLSFPVIGFIQMRFYGGGICYIPVVQDVDMYLKKRDLIFMFGIGWDIGNLYLDTYGASGLKSETGITNYLITLNISYNLLGLFKHHNKAKE